MQYVDFCHFESLTNKMFFFLSLKMKTVSLSISFCNLSICVHVYPSLGSSSAFELGLILFVLFYLCFIIFLHIMHTLVER